MPAHRPARSPLSALAVALALACGSAAAQPGMSDALLAVEANRANIVAGIVERFGAQSQRLGAG